MISSFRVSYPPCSNKDHEGEVLALACMDKSFSSSRLLCRTTNIQLIILKSPM